ncbi:MutH/Sau3AI family endonuclease [Candidatus Contendibacter odensensis]|uniref:DNA mismatch repair MutH/Type II restriction enzyme Sau3AI domain-containing protein n=1 Tax=Candidatus Contendobacter odensis Run_B_J11 TaxID=1400861 RepID=A0A7U7J4A1_9GAMM|nr:MutH/Sau3AI family endonuclease [Candidatus Contendobacter odensis]CDH47031.1 conserved hypothetical protein [Candidatus Contendobacter odensis Run_B_J11]
MERAEALLHIRELTGKDLRPLADYYGLTVWKDGKKNKGWTGHVIERYLGLPLNSSPAPNFGSWELKVVPLKYDRNRVLKVKETMAITMLDPVEVLAKDFEDSHLFTKLRKQIVVSHIFEDVNETSAILHTAAEFDLDNPHVYAQVKADYETVRAALQTSGFSSLTGKMGILVQPRTKGAGHGSISRAFYARTTFVAHILNIAAWPGMPVAVPEEYSA